MGTGRGQRLVAACVQVRREIADQPAAMRRVIREQRPKLVVGECPQPRVVAQLVKQPAQPQGVSVPLSSGRLMQGLGSSARAGDGV